MILGFFLEHIFHGFCLKGFKLLNYTYIKRVNTVLQAGGWALGKTTQPCKKIIRDMFLSHHNEFIQTKNWEMLMDNCALRVILYSLDD